MTKTKEIPLSFTKENRALVRAKLKTETRRIAKALIEGTDEAELPWRCFRSTLKFDGIYHAERWECFRTPDELAGHRSPYGGKGKPFRYYMKEPVQVLSLHDGDIAPGLWAKIIYPDTPDDAPVSVQLSRQDYHKLISRKDWRKPSTGMFMLKSFARTWLTPERLWVEKLGEITVAGAIAEGIELNPDLRSNLASGMETLAELGEQPVWRDYISGGYDLLPVQSYASLWNSINGAGSWNPEQWVWCIRFEKED